jgi:heme-degrading monooxygenase HmoA
MSAVMRVWRGQGSHDGVARYCEHFRRRVLPQLEALEGFLSAHVLVRAAGDSSEVIVMTAWASVDAVKAFAGENSERAVVEPVVADLLDRYDDTVTHFEIAAAHLQS